MTRLRLVKPPAPKWGASRSQRSQREMAWLLYISEGYWANLMASAVGNLSSEEKAAHRLAIKDAANTCTNLRRLLCK